MVYDGFTTFNAVFKDSILTVTFGFGTVNV